MRTGCPNTLSIVAVMVISSACGRARTTEAERARKADPKQHASTPAARFRALLMDHDAVQERLGPHRYQGRHEVEVTVDRKPDQAYVDDYRLRCTRKGDCYGRLDNSLEYGVEFYRIGDTTFFRHRYQRFLRFQEEPQEARSREQHLWGAGAAVVELIGPNLKITRGEATEVAGRPAVRYRLTLGSKKRPREKGRRAWRSKIQPVRIQGEALLDKATGVPLQLRLSYAVRAPKEGHTVEIAGVFKGGLVQVGKPQVVKPPADYVQARPRDREVRDLKLLGNHRLHPGWFRAGGPRAGHRRALHRQRHPMAGTAPAMRPAPRRPRARPAPRAMSPRSRPRR